MFFIIEKYKILVVTICFILIALILFFVARGYHTAFSQEIPPVDVIVDPGHGGFDSGAIGVKGSFEKDFNLAISLKLRDKLVADGITVGMTRDTDTAVGSTKKSDMYWRRDFTFASHPKLFVSIHQNSYPDGQYRGAQVFYSKNNPESLAFATAMQNMLKSTNSQNKREPKKADNSVFLLKQLTMPAILIECGFISNYDEEWLLSQDSYQDQLAEAIKQGIEDELNKLNSATPSPIAPTTSNNPTPTSPSPIPSAVPTS